MVHNQKKEIRFIDTFKFMSANLDISRFTEKNFYPYDYMESFDKFLYPFPSHKQFYNTLKNKNISIDD